MAEQPNELGLEKAGAFPIRLSGALVQWRNYERRKNNEQNRRHCRNG